MQGNEKWNSLIIFWPACPRGKRRHILWIKICSTTKNIGSILLLVKIYAIIPETDEGKIASKRSCMPLQKLEMEGKSSFFHHMFTIYGSMARLYCFRHSFIEQAHKEGGSIHANLALRVIIVNPPRSIVLLNKHCWSKTPLTTPRCREVYVRVHTE